MDKRFFQLLMTPYVSAAISGDIDPNMNFKIMLKRVLEMSPALRKETLLMLQAELKVSQAKLPSLPADLKPAYQKKIKALDLLIDHIEAEELKKS